ncbi:response regulator [Alphaproteobacteria bacterium]|nr:response regulator [Alphaproteobacteria bacterium]
MSKILIIDDEIEICKQVSLILSKNGFETKYATSYKDLYIIINDGFDFDLVLVDLWIKNSSKQGIDIIQELKSLFSNLIIISFSGHANIDNAIESVKAGANDFIEKPFESKKLIHIIEKNLLELKQRITINNYRSQISFHSKINLIGLPTFTSPIEKKIEKIKIYNSILIHGPSGIGKNFLANKIHMQLSSNNTDTFINMNENLMNESDLLKFNSLHNYFTIYLNDFEKFNKLEILNYFNLIKNKNINAVIIFDTKNFNKEDPLLKDIDLIIRLDPLEKRKNEIFGIFKHYINVFFKKKFEIVPIIDEQISVILNSHIWPGNIFELMNISEVLINKIENPNHSITLDLVKDIISSSVNNADIYDLNFKEAKNKFEKEYLEQKLRSNNWNMTLTAKNLNLDRVSLYRKVKSLGINIE